MTFPLATGVRAIYRRVADFFGRQVWEARLDELSPRLAVGYSAARIAQRAFHALVLDDALHVRSAALTYFTVLSLVPFLAFVFSVLKGFGAYDLLVAETIRPYVLRLLSGNQALSQAFDRILGFVEQTGVASLGLLGLLTLLYAATRLLRNVEAALNVLWDARRSRTPLEQLRDYVSIMAITPLCLLAAAALTTASQAVQVLRAAGETLGLSAFVDQVLALFGPLSTLFLGLLLLYRVMPCARVSLRSAALGAALGAVAWYLVLIVHVRFQIGVGRFNALYSSFAAFPIFLAWLHISWLVVLLGAQVAATHQNGRSLAQRTRSAAVDQAQRESIAIAAMVHIAANFAAGRPPVSARAQGAELDVDEPLLTELLERLVLAGFLIKVAAESTHAYVLARPAEQIRIKDILDAQRRSGRGGESAGTQVRAGALAARAWQELDDELARSPRNRTLRELAEAAPE